MIAERALSRLGILDEVKDRVRHIERIPVAELVAKGEIEIGMQQVNAILPVAGTALLLSAPQAWVCRVVLASPPLVWIGLISYPLYLWHWPVYVLFRWTVGLDDLWTCLAAAVIAFALAIVSYEIVEQPARRFQWQKRMSVAKFIPAALAAVLVVSGATAAVFKYKSRLTLSVTGNTDVWYPLARKSIVSAR